MVAQTDLSQREKRLKAILQYQTQSNQLLRDGDFPKVVDVARQGLDFVHKHFGTDHAETVYLNLLLGEAYMHLGFLDLALQHLLAAKATIDRLPGFTDHHVYSIACHRNLAVLARTTGRLGESRELFAKIVSTREATQGRRHPDTLVALTELAVTLKRQGCLDGALEIFQEVLQAQKELFGPSSLTVASTYNHTGSVHLCQGRWYDALAAYAQGQAIMQARGLEDHPDHATLHCNIGIVLTHLGRHEEALDALRKALELRTRLLGAVHHDTALCELHLARTYLRMTRLDDAESHALGALDVHRSLAQYLHDQDPSITQAPPNASLRHTLSPPASPSASGTFPASPTAPPLHALGRTHTTPLPRSPRTSSPLSLSKLAAPASSLSVLAGPGSPRSGGSPRGLKRSAEPVKELVQDPHSALQCTLAPPIPTPAGARVVLIDPMSLHARKANDPLSHPSLNATALSLTAPGPSPAEPLGETDPLPDAALLSAAPSSDPLALRRALGEGADGEPAPRSLAEEQELAGAAQSMVVLGDIELHRMAYDRALEYYKQARMHFDAIHGFDDELEECLANIANVYMTQGQSGCAYELYTELVRKTAQSRGPEHPATATLLNALGNVYRQQGRHEEALGAYKRAAAIFEKACGSHDASTATVHINIGNIYYTTQRLTEAMRHYVLARSIRERLYGPVHEATATAYRAIGASFLAQQRFAEALEFFQRALDALLAACGPDHADVRALRKTIANLVREQARRKELLAHSRKEIGSAGRHY